MEHIKETKLVCEVVDGKDLPNVKDLVVTLLFGKAKKKTNNIKSKTSRPVWQEQLEFEIDSSAFDANASRNGSLPDLQVLLVENKSKFGGGRIVHGQSTIHLPDEKLSYTFKETWVDLQQKDGELIGHVRLKLKIEHGTVEKKKQTQKKNTPKSSSGKKSDSKKTSSTKGNSPAIFQYIREKNLLGLEDFLQNCSSDEVNVALPKTGNTPLHEACIEREEQILNTLLKYDGIDVDRRNMNDNTPLHYFCEKWNSPKYLESFNLFIKCGADINALNSNGETPIFKAIFNNSIRTLLMEALILHDADVNTITKTAGEGVLHYAVRLGRSDLVNLILQAKPNLDLKGSDGLTPLELAKQYKFTKIADHLQQVQLLFQFLDDNDLADYKGTFLKNEITLGLMSDITEENLRSMGITSVGVILKIMNACKNIKGQGMALNLKKETDLTEERLEEFANELADLQQGETMIIDGKQLEYLKHLGTGASGDVYKGLYKGTPVAIKVLKEMTMQQKVDEFKKEFEIMSAVRSPNVVFFYGACMQPRLCMVMEYCARGSLSAAIKDPVTQLGWERAIMICRETCIGLNALHSNNPQILHRDLKSLNLLVTQDWKIKLCDFGLSRFVSSENMETMRNLRGTFAYCDPEVYNGATFCAASDIYSLGIIMWEVINRLIKGKYEQPYSEYRNLTFDFQIIVQAAKENLRPTIPPQCPPMFKKLISSCILPKQVERPKLDDIIKMLEMIESEYKANTTVWEKAKLG